MFLRRIVTVVAAAALLAACGTGETPGSTPTPTSSDGSGTLGSESPSAAPAPSSATTPAISYPTDANAYALAAIAAWAAGDVATLDGYEDQSGQLHSMLSCSGCYNTAFAIAPNYCQGAAGSSYCLYFNAYGDELLLQLVNQFLGQPRAIQGGGSTFTPTAFPSDNKAYATEALNAYLDGNDNRLKLLTQQGMTATQLNGQGASQSANWTYDSTQGAAGTSYVVFTAGGHTLAFGFSNQAPNPAPTTGSGAQHRITNVSYL